jgi:hypothetical protein
MIPTVEQSGQEKIYKLRSRPTQIVTFGGAVSKWSLKSLFECFPSMQIVRIQHRSPTPNVTIKAERIIKKKKKEVNGDSYLRHGKVEWGLSMMRWLF